MLIDPNETEAILDWPTPMNVTHAMSFLGFTICLRSFIVGFFEIVALLHGLRRYFCACLDAMRYFFC